MFISEKIFSTPRTFAMIQRRFGRRKEIDDPSISDKELPFSQLLLSIVVRDWKILLRDFHFFAVRLFSNFITEHPSYKKLFPNLGETDDDTELESNRVFINHAYGIVNGISSALDSLTGEYEDDCELLSTISRSHMRRGITAKMFRDLKESVLESCFLLLHSDKKSKAAWTTVLNFIFDDYLSPPNEIKKYSCVVKVPSSLEKEVSDFCVKLP